jgi:hypothetical protein
MYNGIQERGRKINTNKYDCVYNGACAPLVALFV